MNAAEHNAWVKPMQDKISFAVHIGCYHDDCKCLHNTCTTILFIAPQQPATRFTKNVSDLLSSDSLTEQRGHSPQQVVYTTLTADESIGGYVGWGGFRVDAESLRTNVVSLIHNGVLFVSAVELPNKHKVEAATG